MTTQFFQGVEFDWLQRQIQAVLWDPSVLNRTATPQPRPQLSVKSQGLGLPDHIVRECASARARATQFLPPVDDAPPAGLTTSEYNAWRAAGPPSRAHRYPYVHQAYPMMLYKADEKPKTVKDAAEHARASKAGWKERPV